VVTVVIWGSGGKWGEPGESVRGVVGEGITFAFCITLVVLCLLVDGLLLSSTCRESCFGFEAVTEVG